MEKSIIRSLFCIVMSDATVDNAISSSLDQRKTPPQLFNYNPMYNSLFIGGYIKFLSLGEWLFPFFMYISANH